MSPPAKTALRGIVAVALIGLLLWIVGPYRVAEVLAGADPGWMALAFAVAAVDRAVMVGKWLPLLWALEPGIGAGRATRVYLAATFGSIFLPSSVGADALRALALGRPRGRIVEVAASVVMERALGFLGMSLVLLLALAVGMGHASGVRQLWPYALLGAGTALALFWLLLSSRGTRLLTRGAERLGGRAGDLLGRAGSAWASYRDHPRTVALVGAASTMEQLVPIVVYGLLATSLGLALSPLELFVAVPVTLFVGRLPITVSGVGVEEGVFVFLMGLFGVAPAAALSLALARRVVESLILVPGAFFWSDLTEARRSADAPGVSA